MMRCSSTHRGREKVFKDAIKVLLDENAPKPSAECGFCHWAKGCIE